MIDAIVRFMAPLFVDIGFTSGRPGRMRRYTTRLAMLGAILGVLALGLGGCGRAALPGYLTVDANDNGKSVRLARFATLVVDLPASLDRARVVSGPGRVLGQVGPGPRRVASRDDSIAMDRFRFKTFDAGTTDLAIAAAHGGARRNVFRLHVVVGGR